MILVALIAYHQKSFNSIALQGCPSFLSAFASICRMRSRVTPYIAPTSSSVRGRLLSKPVLRRITSASLGVNELSAFKRALLAIEAATFSNSKLSVWTSSCGQGAGASQPLSSKQSEKYRWFSACLIAVVRYSLASEKDISMLSAISEIRVSQMIPGTQSPHQWLR